MIRVDKTEEINKMLGVTESYQAPEALMKILFNKNKREELFEKMLELFDYKMEDEWFFEYFQDEHADRKVKKQDFTPKSVSKLLTSIVDQKDDGMRYEPCAGTGGITISMWYQDRNQHTPFDYQPSFYFYTCEELSDRAIPFLLFNIMIRGMNANVIHCDTLTRKAKGAFFVQNDKDDYMHFSSLNVLSYTKEVEEHLGIVFTEEKYERHIESPASLVSYFVNQLTSKSDTIDHEESIGQLSLFEDQV